MSETKVICLAAEQLRKRYGDESIGFEKWLENPNHIYIGRFPAPVTGARYPKVEYNFGNPFSVDPDKETKRKALSKKVTIADIDKEAAEKEILINDEECNKIIGKYGSDIDAVFQAEEEKEKQKQKDIKKGITKSYTTVTSENKYSRKAVLCLYREYLKRKIAKDETFKQQVLGLKGKTLGCWCKPEPCHGDVLIDVINELSPTTKAVQETKSVEESSTEEQQTSEEVVEETKPKNKKNTTRKNNTKKNIIPKKKCLLADN